MSGVCLGSKLHAIVLWLRFLWGWPIKDAFLDNPSKLLGCWAVGLGYKYKFSFWAWPVLLGCYRLPLFKAPMWIRIVQAFSPFWMGFILGRNLGWANALSNLPNSKIVLINCPINSSVNLEFQKWKIKNATVVTSPQFSFGAWYDMTVNIKFLCTILSIFWICIFSNIPHKKK